jgi:hypothetical protein
MTTEHEVRDGAPPNDGPVGGAPGPSADIDRERDGAGDGPSGLPDQAEEATPLGTDDADPDGEGDRARGAEAMPGIPTGGEPPDAG